MKIVIINSVDKHGITYQIKQQFLSNFENKAEIVEFNLPTDCPSFCNGCHACFLSGEDKCKDYAYVSKIVNALTTSDLIVIVNTTYELHIPGSLKTLFDHLGFMWMSHRPNPLMFNKRAVVLSLCAGIGAKQAAKYIKSNLSWWGISDIKLLTFKLMDNKNSTIEQRVESFKPIINKFATKLLKVNYDKDPKVSLMTKVKFAIMRMMQRKTVKQTPDALDFKYWKNKGWLNKTKPWKKQ